MAEKITLRHFQQVKDAKFSPNGRHLATASVDRTAAIWELADGRWRKKATIMHSRTVNHVSFSPDGSHLVTASFDKTARVWLLKSRVNNVK